MKVQNPIMKIDMPDPDVIRVGDTYYMVSTTMFVMPGGPVLKSKDLVHWEIAAYLFDIIEDNEIYRLEHGKNAYGQGQWATSLTYYQGRFYACFVCHDMKKTYIYHSDQIEKSGWERYVLHEAYHDMSFLFDNGKAYLLYGNGEINILELKEDLSGVKPGGIHQLLISTRKEGMGLRAEGCRAYQKDGYYYILLIDWPKEGKEEKGIRREVCYRSKDLFGPYEFRVLVEDTMGSEGNGIAQGVLIDAPDGSWYGILFQDQGALGRIPHLMPVEWVDGWPVMTRDGLVPKEFEVPFLPYEAKPLIESDSFCHEKNELSKVWEWNHNPVKECWSFTEKKGSLRLHAVSVTNHLMTARNTLTQKTSGPACGFTVELKVTGMKPGDYAGLAAFQGTFGTIGIEAGEKEHCVVLGYGRLGAEQVMEPLAPFTGERIYLKVFFDFDLRDSKASFYYSEDGNTWVKAEREIPISFTLDLFIGYRIALFHYAQTGLGGYSDWSNFIYEPEESVRR